MAPDAMDRIAAAIEGGTGRLWDPPNGRAEMTYANGVAYIPIFGALAAKENWFLRWIGGTAYTQIERDVRHAAADPDVERIVLLVDSPGGEAGGAEECAAVIRSARERKPVVSAIRGWCCSGGYYLASQATRIVASPSSTIGSIGVLYRWVGRSRMNEEFGLDIRLRTHGEDKAFLYGDEPWSDRKAELIDRWVSEIGDAFDASVAAGRGVTAERVRTQFGGGQIWQAPAALERGLIDAIGDVREAATGDVPSAPTPITATTPTTERVMKWSQRVRAMLLAVGILPAETNLESTDDAHITSLIAVLYGSEQNIPRVNGQADRYDEAAVCIVLAARMSPSSTPLAAAVPAQTAATPSAPAVPVTAPATAPAATVPATAPAPPVNPATPPPSTGPLDDPRVRENQRVRAIQSAAASLRGRGYTITAEQEQQAIANVELSAEQATHGWVTTPESHPERPLNPPRQTGSGEEAWAAMVTDAICLRVSGTLGVPNLFPGDQQPSADAQRMRNAPIAQLFLDGLERTGEAVQLGLDRYSQPDNIVRQALAMDPELRPVASSINRPGHAGAIMANVANRVLNRVLETHVQTFERWSVLMTGVDDFHPRSLVETVEFGELDRRGDTEEPRERALSGEAVGWYQNDIFSNKVGLTVRMIVDNKLDQWAQSLASLQRACRRTMNRLHLELLTSNPDLLDGQPMFHANFNNLITAGGGAPSDAQLQAMRDQLVLQKAPGNEAYITSQFAAVLCSAKHQNVVEKLLLTSPLYPVTQDQHNVWNGTGEARGLQPIIDVDLQSYDPVPWYALVSPMDLPAFAHGYRSGYGPEGLRSTWFEPGNETRWVKLENHMGAGIKGRRGWVKNPGA